MHSQEQIRQVLIKLRDVDPSVEGLLYLLDQKGLEPEVIAKLLAGLKSSIHHVAGHNMELDGELRKAYASLQSLKEEVQTQDDNATDFSHL